MKRRLVSIAILTLAIAVGGSRSMATAPPEDSKPSVTVFPVVTSPDKFPEELARRVGIVVATLLEKAGLEDLQVADTMFKPPETDDVDAIARAFSEQVGARPIDTEFAVFTQFIGTPKTGVQGICTIVVDRSGNWVMIDMQNSHDPNFKHIAPKSAADCNRLLLARLKDWLSE